MTLNTSLTRPTTRCHLNIPLSHFVSNTNKPKHHESYSTKSKPYSKLQIKNFRCCVVKEKFRNSFVLPKKYSAKQITISLSYRCLYLFKYGLKNFLQTLYTQIKQRTNFKTLKTFLDWFCFICLYFWDDWLSYAHFSWCPPAFFKYCLLNLVTLMKIWTALFNQPLG